MKKKLLVLTLGAMGLLLVSCNSKTSDRDVAQNTAYDMAQDESSDKEVIDIEIDDSSEEDIYEGMAMGNPWVDSDKAGVLEATGFDMEAPADAANVAYSYMTGTGMAQMNYVMEDAMWVYRMQHTDELEDISGMHYDWNYIEDSLINGMNAVEYSYASGSEDGFLDSLECVRVINWYDDENKVTHSLSVIGNDLNGMDTHVYAENLMK